MLGEIPESEVGRMNAHADLPVYRTLQTTVFGGVATVTLNRPARRNAVGDGMRDELADAYRRCDAADDVRVIVLTGARRRSVRAPTSPRVSARSPRPGRASARPVWTCPPSP